MRPLVVLGLALLSACGEPTVCLSDDAESGVGVDTCQERLDASDCASGFTEEAEVTVCAELGFDMVSTACDALAEKGSSLWIRSEDCPTAEY